MTHPPSRPPTPLARLACLAALLALGAGLALAQAPDPAAMASQYASNAKSNAAAMRQYAWKMRVEMTIKGDPKPAQLYQMRFDLDGKLQKTPLTPRQEQEPQRGLRGRIKQRKIEDFKEWADNLGDLVKDYLAPSPAIMGNFYGKASFSRAEDGSVQVTAGEFIQPGDKATFWLDAKTKAALRFAFETSLDGDPVQGQVEFAKVEGGPQYAARVTVDAPGRSLTAVIENFSYEKQ